MDENNPLGVGVFLKCLPKGGGGEFCKNIL